MKELKRSESFSAAYPYLLPDQQTRMSFRFIPPGLFHMGNTGGHSPEPDTEPVHPVEIAGFWMAIFPVTNEQFRAFVQTTRYRTRREQAPDEHPFWSDYAGPDQAQHPVIAVNWLDAVAFCHWAGLRLATEAEWEYAARGGLDGAEFPWGDAPPSNQCNWRHSQRRPALTRFSSLGGVTPVDSYPPNAYGLHDMAGNVWEWVADAYQSDYYRNSPVHQPVGPTCDDNGLSSVLPDWSQPQANISPQSLRVSRGGCWENQDFGLRCCERIFAHADTRNKPHVSGFRCALNLPPPPL
jgi:formylglycine-generating enzyme required for sulfatase activity